MDQVKMSEEMAALTVHDMTAASAAKALKGIPNNNNNNNNNNKSKKNHDGGEEEAPQGGFSLPVAVPVSELMDMKKDIVNNNNNKVKGKGAGHRREPSMDINNEQGSDMDEKHRHNEMEDIEEEDMVAVMMGGGGGDGGEEIGAINPEAKKLYVGNLNPDVDEDALAMAFGVHGNVELCKVIRDKETGTSAGYGFVDFEEHEDAQTALFDTKPYSVLGKDVKVTWANQATAGMATYFPLFVGDLSPDIDDDALFKAFSDCEDCMEARVLIDPLTHRSRGYGFVTFRTRETADNALNQKNNSLIGRRNVRVNWANQRSPTVSPKGAPRGASATNAQQRTVYVGNLAGEVTEGMVRDVFEEVGSVKYVRFQPERGFAFVVYYSLEDAVSAIKLLNGRMIASLPIKCAWGREKPRDNSFRSGMMMGNGTSPTTMGGMMSGGDVMYDLSAAYGSAAGGAYMQPYSFMGSPYMQPAAHHHQMPVMGFSLPPPMMPFTYPTTAAAMTAAAVPPHFVGYPSTYPSTGFQHSPFPY